MNNNILVHLGGGLGNIIMATPMMEMLSRAGFAVDLCIQGETKGIETLFYKWPHIRTVSPSPAEFVGNVYSHYIYGDYIKSEPIDFINRRNAIIIHPVWDWLKEFNLYSEIEMYVNIARCIAPSIPVVLQPSICSSGRRFREITSNTVVIIPGGQRPMVLRKWPWYDKIAARMPDVAVVGLSSDLDMSNRIVFPKWARKLLGDRLNYCGRCWHVARIVAERHDRKMEFPNHVKNYIDKLSLEDTAAAIGQAGLIVGNDSGLIHVALALGKKAVMLTGPSSQKKNFPGFLKNLTTISLDYECQPCQEKRELRVWQENVAQSFCPYHFRCMNDLGVERVLEAIGSHLPSPTQNFALSPEEAGLGLPFSDLAPE